MNKGNRDFKPEVMIWHWFCVEIGMQLQLTLQTYCGRKKISWTKVVTAGLGRERNKIQTVQDNGETGLEMYSKFSRLNDAKRMPMDNLCIGLSFLDQNLRDIIWEPPDRLLQVARDKTIRRIRVEHYEYPDVGTIWRTGARNSPFWGAKHVAFHDR